MDINLRAFQVVNQATSEKLPTDNPRREAARRGGLAGGPSRAKSITKERRVEIAKKASAARWKKHNTR